MNWTEFIGAFYAVYGVCWLVFTLSPWHKPGAGKASSSGFGSPEEDAANRQNNWTVSEKTAA